MGSNQVKENQEEIFGYHKMIYQIQINNEELTEGPQDIDIKPISKSHKRSKSSKVQIFPSTEKGTQQKERDEVSS